MAVGFTLRQLEYFDAVVSAGSLSEAARRCRVTPSALTLALDDLERHLGVQLLIRRKGKGVTVTPAGSRLLVHTRGVFGNIEALVADASSASTELVGHFAVGCFTTLAPFFLPPILAGFAGDFPSLVVEATTGSADELQEGLLQGRLDSALMYSVDVPPSLEFDPVVEYRPYVLLPADHPRADQARISLGDIAAEAMIMLDMPPTRHNTELLFAQLGLPLNVRHVATGYEVVRCLVGYGLGYAILFQRPRTNTTYDGHEVRMVEIADAVAGTTVGLCRPKGAPRAARQSALLEFLRHHGEAREGAGIVTVGPGGRADRRDQA